ncbi:glycosyltransferase family 25 protein [Candidatus Spongiihabitans sp.]|uniref:glycosyltransferase family 25 protein n=1 Tax=Candidatus Spongiihabitans sp. TaxID=3101308 RepID=UPI003C7036B4
MLPPIYVISLARAKEHRADISSRLDSAGVAYQIIEAVDGETLDLLTLKDRLVQDIYWFKKEKKMTVGETGCYLSHYNLWERMVAEQTPFALVLEDDAVWEDDFFEVVEQLVQSKYYWNVVHCACPKIGRIYSTLSKVGNNRKFVRFKHPMGITAAYLIDLDGAKKLQQHCYKIRDSIDMQWLLYWQCNLYFYFVQPPPAQGAIDETTIGSRPIAKNKHQLKSEMGVLKYLIKANRERYARRFYHWTHPPKKRK